MSLIHEVKAAALRGPLRASIVRKARAVSGRGPCFKVMRDRFGATGAIELEAIE
jgi:hypothetical protein